MTWVTWQQHRAMLTAGVALLLAIAAVLVVSGITIHQTFGGTALPECLAQGGLDQGCLALRNDFAHRYGDVAGIVQVFVTIFPLVGGTFLGATLLGREYETRTRLLAWTQSVTRLRWTAVKLLVLGCATLVAWAGLTC